ncbi:MAG TPA: 50S ribosomal protein L32e [Candidatus Nanopusillus sp.]|nr:50S ribosomal protein L32e [Candidatus Nanopusillus sp.]HIP89971.1 50S ribosomal protein L32e [Candidatus Nanopusillus sp.]
MVSIKSLLRLRKKIKRKKPNHFRPHWWTRPSLKRKKNSWRRPHGIHNKIRRRLKGRPAMVETGYGSPKKVRGLLPNGRKPVIIHNIKELERVDKEKEAAIIASAVGKRKRLEIIRKARELEIEIWNIRPAELKELQSAN